MKTSPYLFEEVMAGRMAGADVPVEFRDTIIDCLVKAHRENIAHIGKLQRNVKGLSDHNAKLQDRLKAAQPLGKVSASLSKMYPQFHKP